MPAEGVLHSAGAVLRSAEVVLRSAGAVLRSAEGVPAPNCVPHDVQKIELSSSCA